MSETDELLDRLRIRELVERYGMCADLRDQAQFGSLFAQDAVLTAGGTDHHGPKEIAEVLNLLAERYPHSMHFVGNHIVELSGDEATGITYCLAHHLYPKDDVQRDTLMLIRYHDAYRRTPHGWRFTSRELVMDWQEDRPISV
jgi:hypothetical protein